MAVQAITIENGKVVAGPSPLDEHIAAFKKKQRENSFKGETLVYELRDLVKRYKGDAVAEPVAPAKPARPRASRG